MKKSTIHLAFGEPVDPNSPFKEINFRKLKQRDLLNNGSVIITGVENNKEILIGKPFENFFEGLSQFKKLVKRPYKPTEKNLLIF